MIKLITSSFVKAECELSDEIENRELDNPIKQAQDRLKFILGRELFEDVYNQGITSPTTYSTANTALFDPYIKQFLAWQAHEFYLIKSTAISKRGGLRVLVAEADESPSDQIVNLHIKTAKEMTEFYKGQLVNFLIENETTYTLYDVDCTTHKMGTGSGITGVARLSHSTSDIYKKTINNGD